FRASDGRSPRRADSRLGARARLAHRRRRAPDGPLALRRAVCAARPRPRGRPTGAASLARHITQCSVGAPAACSRAAELRGAPPPMSAEVPARMTQTRPASDVLSVDRSSATWRDYYELGKPRVVMLIMFTAIAGIFLATPGFPPVSALVFGTIGIALASSSAAAVNHVLDRRFDVQMARTRNRPLPTG